MVAPGAAGASFEVLLEFALDEEANKRVAARTSTIQEELKRIEGQAKKTGQAVSAAMQGTEKKAEAAEKSVVKLGAELAKLGGRAQQSSKQVNQAVDSNIQKFKQLEEVAKRVRQQAGPISGAAARGSAIFGQGLLAGGAIVGGIIAEANRYAKEEEGAKRVTAATREWTRATEDLAKARGRIDAVLLRETLPLLQDAARIANQVADFVERNPQIVQAALKTGLVVAGLSAVGLAVTKGIKLVADVAYISAVATELLAAKLHNQAADKELAAAAAKNVTNRADDLRSAFGLSGKAGGAGLLTGLTSPLGIATLFAGVAVASDQAAKNLLKLEDVLYENAIKAGKGVEHLVPIFAGLETLLTTATPLGPAFLNLRRSLERDIPLIKNLLTGASEGERGAPGTRGGRLRPDDATRFASLDIKEDVLKAYEDYRADDLALVQKHYADRQDIVQDALAAERKANENYASDVRRVNAQTSKSLAEAARQYAESEVKAEQQNAQERARIVRDGGQEIQRMETDLQERLRKLRLDHEERTSELVAARDALGLVKEQRRYDQERSEEIRQTNLEIRERRADIAQRLADLQQSYAQERAERLADYQARVAEIQASARERLAELQQQHQQELREIQLNKINRLREVDLQFNEERKRRYQYLLQQIRDLDAGLLGERNLRTKHQAAMLQDLDRFLISYRSRLASLGGASTGTIGTRDSGGYADPGLYRIGQREFVLNNASMRTAERIIGSQLTQENLVRALSGMGGNRQVNYLDQRRMERSLSKDDRAAYEQGALDVLNQVLGG
jgi:hypothetical protein